MKNIRNNYQLLRTLGLKNSLRLIKSRRKLQSIAMNRKVQKRIANNLGLHKPIKQSRNLALIGYTTSFASVSVLALLFWSSSSFSNKEPVIQPEVSNVNTTSEPITQQPDTTKNLDPKSTILPKVMPKKEPTTPPKLNDSLPKKPSNQTQDSVDRQTTKNRDRDSDDEKDDEYDWLIKYLDDYFDRVDNWRDISY